MAKQLYIDFDQYIRQGEPDQKEKAYVWSTAIGLQAVDGLTTSEYLQETARRNIEGEITIDEAQNLIKSYYINKTKRDKDDDEKEEADRVSSNIAKILSTRTLEFSTLGYTTLHKRIFQGVFKHAGKIRDFDISKREWVLRGDSVSYWSCEELRMALDYDIEQEKTFSYKGLTMDEVVRHITRFVSGIWEIHAFQEGNTRTTAVFTIQYLRSTGFNVNNDLFAQNSWYFRNALVRANYVNHAKGIEREPIYLERFFRNLLMGEQWVLKNRYLVIDPPEEFKDQPRLDVPDKYPTSTRQVEGKWNTTNPNILALVKVIGNGEISVKDMLSAMALKNRESFMDVYLNPAIKEGFVRMLYPQSPRHPRQRYLLTIKGLGIYNKIK